MSREDVKTAKLAVEEIVGPSWATAAAVLERISPQGVFALRLGLIELGHRVLDEMAQLDAKPELVNRLRYITEALAHLPWA